MLTTKEIMEIIPHRHPFLLVDTVTECEPGQRAVGYKCVTYDEPYFAGHFPGDARCLTDRSLRTGRSGGNSVTGKE